MRKVIKIIYNAAILLIAFGVGIFFYENIFKGQIIFAFIIAVFLIVYGTAMALSQFGMHKIIFYDEYAIYQE